MLLQLQTVLCTLSPHLHSLVHSKGNTICEYVMQEWLRSSEAVEEVGIMDEVPQVLRKIISLHINKPLFERLSIFHDFPPNIQTAIAGMMYPLQVRPVL